MPTTSYKSPGTATVLTVTDASAPWLSASNALTSNGTYAEYWVPPDGAGDPAVERLLLHNFDFSSVPPGATIDGITVRLKAFDDYGDIDFNFSLGAKLYKNSGGVNFTSGDQLGSEKLFNTTYEFTNGQPLGYDKNNLSTWWRAYAFEPVDADYVVYARSGGRAGNDLSIRHTFTEERETPPPGISYLPGGKRFTIDLYGTGGPETYASEVVDEINNSKEMGFEMIAGLSSDSLQDVFPETYLTGGLDIPDDITLTTLGGAADVWGATLTHPIVTDSSFGVIIYYPTNYVFTELKFRLDYVEMAVTYTEESGRGSKLTLVGME